MDYMPRDCCGSMPYPVQDVSMSYPNANTDHYPAPVLGELYSDPNTLQDVAAADLRNMYPCVYNNFYPIVKNVCNGYDTPANPAMYPTPAEAGVNTIILTKAEIYLN